MVQTNNIPALLGQLNLAMRRNTEYSDPDLLKLNLQIRQFSASGLLPRLTLLGPVLLIRPYPDDRPDDTGEVVQAALGTATGFGAMYLDSEQDPSEEVAGIRGTGLIVPYEECELGVRSLLAPRALPLLRQLFTLFKIYPDG